MRSDELDDQNWSLLARYFSGLCSSEEERAVEQWTAAQPNRGREVGMLRAAWDAAGRMPSGQRTEQALRRVAARVGVEFMNGGRLADATPRARAFALRTLEAPRRQWLAVLTAVAAAVALLLSAGLWWERSNGSSGDGPEEEYVTQPGQPTSLELIDGTRVRLGAASRLRVPADFGAGARTVTLDGEAYFAVAAGKRHPFRVWAGATVTEDLGTAFLVQMHSRDQTVDVVVVEGKVALRPDGADHRHAVVLTPGQRGEVAPSGLLTVSDNVDTAALLGWLDGRLAFRRTPLAEVRAVLERWYGVRMELPDSTLAAVPVTASFAGESADEALRTLARLLDLRYERHDATAQFLFRSSR